MVNVIGILTLETVPGLNRQRLNALTAALSRIGFPILWAMVASVTLPLAGINGNNADAAAGNFPTTRFVGIIRPWSADGAGFRL